MEKRKKGVGHVCRKNVLYHMTLKLVEQGCGDSPKEVKDIPYAICDKYLCNTKELFDKTLFCLTKGTDEEKHKKAIKQCNEECIVRRDSNDGKLEQSCGDCKGKGEDPKDCYACKEDYCNEENKVYKHCWKNDGNICKNKFEENCFTERTKDNGEFDFGCGKCQDIHKKCAQCNNGTLCNTEAFFDNAKFCWEKSIDIRKPVSALRECGSQCYVSRDKDGKENRGCGKCNSTSCRDCQDNRCNHWKDVYYCNSVDGVNGVKECNKSDCYIIKLNSKKN
uniref:Uncharacterized protein n=1 Tax=Meloidogyne hapla TaxID=6305 RepID=A0A1I8BUC0_MELHA